MLGVRKFFTSSIQSAFKKEDYLSNLKCPERTLKTLTKKIFTPPSSFPSTSLKYRFSSYVKLDDCAENTLSKETIEFTRKAMLEATQKPELFLINLNEYSSLDDETLTQALKTAINAVHFHPSDVIQAYRISNENMKIKIAKISAAQNGLATSTTIRAYQITDQRALIEIAKIAAAQDGVGTSLFINKYAIEQQDSRIEIAKIAGMQNTAAIEFFSNYKIDDDEILTDLIRVSIKQASSASLSNLDELMLSKNRTTTPLFQKHLKIYGEERTSSDVPPLKLQIIIEQISKHRNRALSLKHLQLFCEKSHSPVFMKKYVSLITSRKKESAIAVHKVIPALLPAKWESAIEDDLSQEHKTLMNFLDVYRKDFRNATSSLSQIYSLTTASLDATKSLDSKTKFKLLTMICNAKIEIADVKKGLALLRTLCSRSPSLLLNKHFSDSPIQELSILFEKILLSDSFINLSSVENLSESYQKTFGQIRIPMALEIYTDGIRTLNDEKVRNTLERFVLSVLKGTFQEERYRTDLSPHLQLIKDSYPKLFDLWKAPGIKTPLYIENTQPELYFQEESPSEKLPNFDSKLTNDLYELDNSLETVERSTHWEDLFLSGSEVADSCLRVDWNPTHSKSLLAYCLDGKNSLIAVKNQQGKILARAILRLLWDEVNYKPVLFLEKLYPFHPTFERTKAIQTYASKYAKKLGCVLLTQSSSCSSYEGTATSYEGPCPYEYADGVDGIISKGVFTIKDLKEI